MAPKIAIVYYSMYGHIKQLAEAEKRGIEAAGGTADLFQVEETLPQAIKDMMHAPPQASTPAFIEPAGLTEYDGFLLGVPTRYGNFPAQWKAFWDKGGQVWMSGGLQGKFGGLFISTAGQGGGQESTAIASMSTFAHFGINYVPLGYKHSFQQLGSLDEIRGGSAWGAGTFAGATGQRQPSKLELEVAEIQGKVFYEIVKKSVA